MSVTLSEKHQARTAATTLAKVPALTGLFWIVKLLTTGMGEALADYLGVTSPILLGVGGGGLFVFAMARQLRADRYRAVTYWTTVSMVAVFGTVLADGLRMALGVNLPTETGVYAVLLAAVLIWWRTTEGTLSIHTIDNRRREILYWTTVMVSFALGTAAGDLTAAYLGLGYGLSILVYGALMLVPLALYRARVINEIGAFWFAYVLTRPLGASVADWLGKRSGLGLGDGPVAFVAIAAIVVLVVYLARVRSDVQDADHRVVQTETAAA